MRLQGEIHARGGTCKAADTWPHRVYRAKDAVYAGAYGGTGHKKTWAVGTDKK